jgi:hypothetical protein
MSSHSVNEDEILSRPHRIAFVRHPLTWYQSFWAYRQRVGWRHDAVFDRRCQDSDFNSFIDRVYHEYPCGFLRDVYDYYCNLATIVGHQESIDRDIRNFLSAYAGIEVTADPGRVNESPEDEAVYTPESMAKVMHIERALYRYGYDYIPEGL